MDLNDVEAIDFNALGGADTIVVNDLSGTDVTEVEHQPRPAPAAPATAQADTVIINATNGDDVVLVVGDASGVSVLGLAAAGQHHRLRGGQRPASSSTALAATT